MLKAERASVQFPPLPLTFYYHGTETVSCTAQEDYWLLLFYIYSTKKYDVYYFLYRLNIFDNPLFVKWMI